MNYEILVNPELKSQRIMAGLELWLDRLHQVIKSNPVSPQMTNKFLAEQMDTSERYLFRKVKKITGLSPQKYLLQFRLHQVMKEMKSGKYKTVKEASHSIGFVSVSYFIIQFEKEFGKRPFHILKEYGWR